MPKVVIPFDTAFKDFHGPGEFEVSEEEARVLLLGTAGIVLAEGETFDPLAPPAPPPDPAQQP